MSYIRTRIASQRNQYVLLQLALDSKQEEVTIKDRYYFSWLIVNCIKT